MGFWRESVSWWIGPEHAWENLNRSHGVAHPAGAVGYTTTRTWPLVFADVESLNAFWATMERFADRRGAEGVNFLSPPVVALAGGRTFSSVEGLLLHPERDLGMVAFHAQGPEGFSLSVELSTRQLRNSLPQLAHVNGYVRISGHEPHDAESQMRVQIRDVTDALIAMTRPATRKELWSSAPVITKFTEAEYYANSRAAKVRRQAWLGSAAISLIGGYFGALFGVIFRS